MAALVLYWVMQKELEGNIWKYAVMLISNKRIFIAILGAYYLTVPGVTPFTIGVILLVSNLAGFLLEIPSGYMSDKMGHKSALVMAKVLMVVSTVLYIVAEDLLFLIIAGAFLSISQAFSSGTGSAFMHETLKALGRDHEFTKVAGKVASIGFAVPIILTALVPFLVSVSYKMPFIVALVIDVIGLVAVMAFKVPPVTQEHIDEVNTTNFKQVMLEGYNLNFFSIAIFMGIIAGFLFSIGIFRAAYQAFLEVPVIWYGVLFGIGRAGAALMVAYSGKIKDSFTLTTFLRFELLLYALLMLILGLTTSLWLILAVLIIMNAFQWGLSRVTDGFQIDIIRNSKFKATLLSVSSQVKLLIQAITSFGVGFAIEKLSYQYGFLCLAIVFVVVLLPLYLYILKRSRAGAYEPRNPK